IGARIRLGRSQLDRGGRSAQQERLFAAGQDMPKGSERESVVFAAYRHGPGENHDNYSRQTSRRGTRADANLLFDYRQKPISACLGFLRLRFVWDLGIAIWNFEDARSPTQSAEDYQFLLFDAKIWNGLAF